MNNQIQTSFPTNNYVNFNSHLFNKSSINNLNICLPICYKKSMSIALSDIIHLEGHSNYTMFYFANGKKLLVSKTMKEYIGSLDEHFVRIHKKFIINLRYLIKFDVKEEMFVLLKDGRRVSVSRRRKKEFLEKTRKVIGNTQG